MGATDPVPELKQEDYKYLHTSSKLDRYKIARLLTEEAIKVERDIYVGGLGDSRGSAVPRQTCRTPTSGALEQGPEYER
ncbi:uncharacterized protein LOC118146826 isoform X3 [Callithrix jacchus]